MHLVTRTLRWTANLALVCLFGGLAVVLISPMWLGLQFRIVVSGSMEPSIPVGSVVMVAPVDATAVQYGDVITFDSPEMPNTVVTHRVIEVNGPGDGRLFRTQGDANEEVDLEMVPAANVLGQVRFHIPYIGHLAALVRTRTGWLYMVVLPGAVLVIIELIRILKIIWKSDGDAGKKAMEIDPSHREPQ